MKCCGKFTKNLCVTQNENWNEGSGGAIGGREGRPPPLTAVLLRMAPLCTMWRIICIFCKIMQTFYIGNLHLGDELAIAQQLIIIIIIYLI